MRRAGSTTVEYRGGCFQKRCGQVSPHRTRCTAGAHRPQWVHRPSGGVLATKVRYFGVKSAKVPQGQMGTKPAKVAHRPSRPRGRPKRLNQAFSP
eukprot:scaffold52868_cov63-Phaeocystis_antarctica.AAC.5